MAGRPLRPATRRRLGRPSPHQQADRTRAHPPPPKLSNPHHATGAEYPVLAAVSNCYPRVKGRLLTRYSPVRHSCTPKGLTVRLACVKHAASVRPEPGSNSPMKTQNVPPENPNTDKNPSRISSKESQPNQTKRPSQARENRHHKT